MLNKLKLDIVWNDNDYIMWDDHSCDIFYEEIRDILSTKIFNNICLDIWDLIGAVRNNIRMSIWVKIRINVEDNIRSIINVK